MKSLIPAAFSLCLALCAYLSVNDFTVAQVPPSAQPPSSLPPSSLPPNSPAPVQPPSIGIGKKASEPDSAATTNALSTNSSEVDAEKIRVATRSSETFAMTAAQEGMLEVELGKIAVTKGANQQVRDFGKHMAIDHEKANAELKRIAKTRNIKLPDELDAEHRARLDIVRGKSGVAFDVAYSAQMAKAHTAAVEIFREASTSTAIDGSLQAFAKKVLPTLEAHNSTAKQLQAGTAAIAPPGT